MCESALTQRSVKPGCLMPLPPNQSQKEVFLKDTVREDPLRQQLRNLPPEKVADFVCKNKKKLLPLKSPAGAKLKIAAVKDTIYRDDPDEVNGWGIFYLPGTVTMQFIGTVEGVLTQCEELALMICREDNHVYAYDEEDLHLVASDMKELCDVGIKYPGRKTYYNGEAFKDMTEKDWEEVRKGKDWRKLDEEYDKLVAKMDFSFLKKNKE